MEIDYEQILAKLKDEYKISDRKVIELRGDDYEKLKSSINSLSQLVDSTNMGRIKNHVNGVYGIKITNDQVNDFCKLVTGKSLKDKRKSDEVISSDASSPEKSEANVKPQQELIYKEVKDLLADKASLSEADIKEMVESLMALKAMQKDGSDGKVLYEFLKKRTGIEDEKILEGVLTIINAGKTLDGKENDSSSDDKTTQSKTKSEQIQDLYREIGINVPDNLESIIKDLEAFVESCKDENGIKIENLYMFVQKRTGITDEQLQSQVIEVVTGEKLVKPKPPKEEVNPATSFLNTVMRIEGNFDFSKKQAGYVARITQYLRTPSKDEKQAILKTVRMDIIRISGKDVKSFGDKLRKDENLEELLYIITGKCISPEKESIYKLNKFCRDNNIDIQAAQDEQAAINALQLEYAESQTLEAKDALLTYVSDNLGITDPNKQLEFIEALLGRKINENGKEDKKPEEKILSPETKALNAQGIKGRFEFSPEFKQNFTKLYELYRANPSEDKRKQLYKMLRDTIITQNGKKVNLTNEMLDSVINEVFGVDINLKDTNQQALKNFCDTHKIDWDIVQFEMETLKAKQSGDENAFRQYIEKTFGIPANESDKQDEFVKLALGEKNKDMDSATQQPQVEPAIAFLKEKGIEFVGDFSDIKQTVEQALSFYNASPSLTKKTTLINTVRDLIKNNININVKSGTKGKNSNPLTNSVIEQFIEKVTGKYLAAEDPQEQPLYDLCHEVGMDPKIAKMGKDALLAKQIECAQGAITIADLRTYIETSFKIGASEPDKQNRFVLLLIGREIDYKESTLERLCRENNINIEFSDELKQQLREALLLNDAETPDLTGSREILLEYIKDKLKLTSQQLKKDYSRLNDGVLDQFIEALIDRDLVKLQENEIFTGEVSVRDLFSGYYDGNSAVPSQPGGDIYKMDDSTRSHMNRSAIAIGLGLGATVFLASNPIIKGFAVAGAVYTVYMAKKGTAVNAQLNNLEKKLVTQKDNLQGARKIRQKNIETIADEIGFKGNDVYKAYLTASKDGQLIDDECGDMLISELEKAVKEIENNSGFSLQDINVFDCKIVQGKLQIRGINYGGFTSEQCNAIDTALKKYQMLMDMLKDLIIKKELGINTELLQNLQSQREQYNLLAKLWAPKAIKIGQELNGLDEQAMNIVDNAREQTIQDCIFTNDARSQCFLREAISRLTPEERGEQPLRIGREK